MLCRFCGNYCRVVYLKSKHMIKWIVSSIFIVLSLLFACLKSVWAGFLYLAIISLASLCIYLTILRIKCYIKDFHINFEKAFIVYKADYVNTYNITSEEFENHLIDHLREFEKLLKREKFVDLFKILFILSLLVVCVVALLNIK